MPPLMYPKLSAWFTASAPSAASAEFLARIAPSAVSHPQAFTDDMLDATSRGLMNGIPITHLGGGSLQVTLREEAHQLQQTVHQQFVSLNRGNMTYKELLDGLIYEGETFQTRNNFTSLPYTHLRFSDESGNAVTERSSGICLLTDKRLLFLSSQLAIATSLAQWGDPKNLPGGYSLQTSFNDKTYYLPIPLRCFRSVEMSGETGVRGEVKVHGVPPCCCGFFQLCASFCCPRSNMMGQWRSQPATRSQVQEMKVTVGVLMPPWERKMFVGIHVDPNVPLPVTRDFMALLQQNAPGLS